MSPLANSYLPPERAQRDGAVLSAAGARLRRVLPRAARGVRVAGARSSATTRTSRRTRRAGSSTPSATSSTMIERFGLDGVEPGRRARLQRRLPAAVLRASAACRCSASSRPRTSPRSPSEQGRPDARRVLRRRDRARGGAPSRKADLLLGNNVLAHVPDLNDFVGGMKVLLAAGRRDHDGVPAPAAADRATTSSTRSTTSTSRTSRSSPSRACSRRTGCGCSTSRSCRRTAARCGSSAATPTTPPSRETDRARASCSSASGARGLRRRSDVYRASAERVQEDKRADPRSS